jgi:acetyl/propionyl-CoA carboxylase alpha subunit
MKVNGLEYRVDWRKFRVGASFFVPCLHLAKSKEAVTAVTKRLGYKVLIKPVIEEGIKGLRVWRIK